MRVIPQTITEAWDEGRFEGDRRPMARVTVQYTRTGLQNRARNLFAYTVFGSFSPQREVVNIKSVRWDRSVDSDAAECTIEIWNTEPLPIGGKITRDLDQPGYLTYNRGTTSFSVRWGHEQNEWSGGARFTQGPGYFVPDNTIRTYEGYGFDDRVFPEDDPHLVQTGCWIIDEVEYTHDGLIVLSCRDYAKMLLEHIVFPPVNPFRAGWNTPERAFGAYAYPVSFTARPFEEQTLGVQPTGRELAFASVTASTNHVDHPPGNAIRGEGEGWSQGVGTYWLSDAAVSSDSYEWIQVALDSHTVQQVRYRAARHRYRVYLHIQTTDGTTTTWQGANSANGLPYVDTRTVKNEDWAFFTFDTPYSAVTAIRLTFTILQEWPDPTPGRRAGLRLIEAWGTPSTEAGGRGGVTPLRGHGNYDDWTDIVKLLCAWGGFYWPTNAGIAKTTESWVPEAPERTFYNWATEDSALTILHGRVWGDFENTGTYGSSDLTPAVFDKKTLMDGINYIREIVGFIFYIDELGSAVWRAPNIYEQGNLILTGADRAGIKTPEIIEIDERHTLIGMRARLSGRNVRERVFVSSSDGAVGAMAAGWNPNPGAGFRRVGGWSDQHFESDAECALMADMIALRQLFAWRTDTITIPANPAIQIDDQVRVFEAVTGAGFLHYVKTVSSNNDLESGEWTYDMELNWLGEYPFQRWAFDPAQLSLETRQYLQGIYNART